MSGQLEGKRVLVVGASAGIGRAIATELVGRGAEVAFCARRKDVLEIAVAQAGGGTVVAGDVRDADDCGRIVEDAVAALGGLDALCYAAAVSPLKLLTDTTVDDWRRVLDTNVVGAALVTRAAVPHLGPGAVVAYLSSESVGRPRHGLVAYAASKLALEELIRGFRVEHPELRFAKVTVGATIGTEFGLEFDLELAGRLFPLWIAHGEMRKNYMEPPEVGEVVVDHLASSLRHPTVDVQEIVIRPPGPLLTDVAEMIGQLEEATGAADPGT
ncbi:MAG TPA: SDR family oxidoreductase [Acidimicrobiia bacterium]|nr:SDR family oxidoreductase [Acidimicrobiia bacterium]